MKHCMQENVHHLDLGSSGKAIRLWGKQPALENISRKMQEHPFFKNERDKKIFFIGSGDFHHVTALLLHHVAKYHQRPITVIHFDNHPDFVNFENGMHCGSWINNASQIHNVDKIITIGVCSADLCYPEYKRANLSLLKEKLEIFPYEHRPSRVKNSYGESKSFQQKGRYIHWQNIKDFTPEELGTIILDLIKTPDVYITIDKDVLEDMSAVTNWDQGKMPISYLASLINQIGKKHQIIAADITGDYSRPYYSGTLWTRFLKWAEIIIDQPHKRDELKHADQVNGNTNILLLEALKKAMS